jgi:hypothetical protein
MGILSNIEKFFSRIQIGTPSYPESEVKKWSEVYSDHWEASKRVIELNKLTDKKWMVFPIKVQSDNGEIKNYYIAAEKVR